MRVLLGTCAATLLSVAGLCVVPPVMAAPDPACDRSKLDVSYSVEDVNIDGRSDVVVGAPHAEVDGLHDAGVVDIHYPGAPSSAQTQRFDESFVGQTPQAGDRFGAAVGYVDNGGGCEGLAIGAPGADKGAGRVTVVRGSNDGIRPTPQLTLTGRHPGDHFGASIALGPGALWVGAPDQTVGGHPGAGAVYRYSFDQAGTVTFLGTVTENTPGVPGTAEDGDHFGQVLASSGRVLSRAGESSVGVLLVGEPDEDVGRARDAGAVTRILVALDGSAHLVRATKVTQDTQGVPDTAEAGDRFGASVTEDRALAVGVPGEQVRGYRHAGLVQMFRTGDKVASPLVPAAAVTQESRTIPGASETGDQFGATVLMGNGNCLWIGAPGESLAGATDTGDVVRTRVGARSDTAAVTAYGSVIRLGGSGADNMPGAPQAGAHVGSALSVETPDDEGESFSGGESVVVSAPGYDGPQTGSGLVWVSGLAPASPDGGPTTIGAGGTYTDTAGPRAGEHYGIPAAHLTNYGRAGG